MRRRYARSVLLAAAVAGAWGESLRGNVALTPDVEAGSAPRLVSLVLSPPTVVGGQTVTATATMDQPAGPNGRSLIIVNGNPAVATMPGSVSFAPGAATGQFTVTTQPVASPTAVQITVGPQQTPPGVATLSVQLASVAAFTLSVSDVFGGAPLSASIGLNGPAPAGGYPVRIASSVPAAVPPMTVVVPAGLAALLFPIPTAAVESVQTVTLTARSELQVAAGVVGTLRSATANVVPIGVRDVRFSSPSLRAGYSMTATVRLSAPAPSGGTTVLVQANGLSVSPATLLIPANATEQTFTITAPCCAGGGGSVSAATPNSVRNFHSVSILPVAVSQLTVTPTLQGHGGSTSATVTIDTVAPPGGAVLHVRASAPTFTESIDLLIPAGTTRSTWLVALPPVPALSRISWHAGATPPDRVSLFSSTPSATLTTELAPPELSMFAIAGPTVIGGHRVATRAGIAAPAPSPGVGILLTAPGGAVQATLPAPVVVPASATEVSFDVVFRPVAQPTAVTITAKTYDRPQAVSRSLTVTVLPPTLIALSFNPTAMTPGSATAGTVTLNAPAPAGGVVVTLAASPNGAVTLPPSITIPAGANTASFPMQAGAVRQTVTVTATALGKAVSSSIGIR